VCVGLLASVGLAACGASSRGMNPDAGGADTSNPGAAGRGEAGADGGVPDSPGAAGQAAGSGGQAVVPSDGGVAGSSDGAAGASDGGGADAPRDAGSSSADVPVFAPSHLVVGSRALELVGSGNDSCTSQLPPATDRWCGFARPGTFSGTELWVINATKAAAGVAITCNTTNANCLRLTGNLLDDQQFHFRIHRFDGDSLIFTEGASGSTTGDIFGWRPGWTAPRKLTSQTGELCIGNKASTTVVCVDNVKVDAVQTRKLDLHAGTLDDQNGGLVPLVDTFIFFTANDAPTDLQRYGWDISPDGRFFAWSGRYDVAGAETLKVQKVGDAGSRVTVAQDVSAWRISQDGEKWLWLGGFNYDGNGNASGMLRSAPFPAGSPTTLLGTNVGDYGEAGPRGLSVRSGLAQGVGVLSLIPDRDAPATSVTLDTKVLTLFDVSRDGTKVLYAKHEDVLGGVLPVWDLFLARADGTPPCTLASSPTAFADPTGPRLLSSGSVAVFGRINVLTGEGEGLFATTSSCTSKKFATEIYAWQPVGDEGFLYSDDLTSLNPNGETSLRFAVATGGALPAVGTKIDSRTGLTFAPLTPAIPGVVYTITAGTPADGLYINATLPFKTTPPN
jgi:hypothetical protein